MSPVVCHEHICHKENPLQLNAPFLIFLKHVPGSSFADVQCPLEVIVWCSDPTVYFFIGNHVLPRYSQHSFVEPCLKCFYFFLHSQRNCPCLTIHIAVLTTHSISALCCDLSYVYPLMSTLCSWM